MIFFWGSNISSFKIWLIAWYVYWLQQSGVNFSRADWKHNFQLFCWYSKNATPVPACFQYCEGIRTAYVWEKEWGNVVLFSRSYSFYFFLLRRHCFNIPIHFSLRTGAVHNCVFGRKCIGKRWCVESYIYKRIIGTINNVYM